MSVLCKRECQSNTGSDCLVDNQDNYRPTRSRYSAVICANPPVSTPAKASRSSHSSLLDCAFNKSDSSKSRRPMHMVGTRTLFLCLFISRPRRRRLFTSELQLSHGSTASALRIIRNIDVLPSAHPCTALEKDAAVASASAEKDAASASASAAATAIIAVCSCSGPARGVSSSRLWQTISTRTNPAILPDDPQGSGGVSFYDTILDPFRDQEGCLELSDEIPRWC